LSVEEYLLNTFIFSTDDLKNLKDDLKDLQRPMKASAFASEEPAPFSPFIPKGKFLNVVTWTLILWE
jgi:hypothetical protein